MGPDLSSHFVRYSHEFVTTVIVITKIDCMPSSFILTTSKLFFNKKVISLSTDSKLCLYQRFPAHFRSRTPKLNREKLEYLFMRFYFFFKNLKLMKIWRITWDFSRTLGCELLAYTIHKLIQIPMLVFN